MLTNGPNLGLLDNGEFGEQGYAELMRMFRALDLLIQPSVISASLIYPPASPVEGDAYIIPLGAADEWMGKTAQIARWTSRSALLEPTWEYFTPKMNWVFGVNDQGVGGLIMRFNGTEWVS